MRPWRELKIKQPTVAIICRGPSILDMTKDDREYLHSRAFVICTNDAPGPYSMRIWADRPETEPNVAKLWAEIVAKKTGYFACRPWALTDDDFDRVDYVFDDRGPKLCAGTTYQMALQLIRRDFPEKNVLLFGADFIPGDDRYFYFDVDGNPAIQMKYPGIAKANTRQIDDFVSYAAKNPGWADKIYNCSPLTHIPSTIFQRTPQWKQML